MNSPTDEEVAAFLSAKGEQEPTWQPIETAPKDGTLVDLWHAEWGRQPNCKWGFPEHTCGEAGQYCDSDWHRLEEGWVDATFNEPTDGDFTHWMPLPLAPKGGAS